jgi:hypothetical protein
LGNKNKFLILSSAEQKLVSDAKFDSGIQIDSNCQLGTLSKIIFTLMKESADSVYRFWLSACIENFLRGCGQIGQLFVSNTGLLVHVTKHILSFKPSVNNALQTSFDLMVRYTHVNI